MVAERASSDSERRTVLVTGATGFLGRPLVRALASRADTTVLAVSRGGGQVGPVVVDSLDLSSREATFAWSDGTSRENKSKLDAIVHLAAVLPPSFDSDEAERSFDANVGLTRNALELAVRDEAAFVYAAGTAVYGSVPGAPATEDAPVQPSDPYTLAKYVGERLGEMAHARAGIPVSVLRIAAPYGPGQRARTVIRIFLEAALASKDVTYHGTGSRTQEFTHVDDVVAALLAALDSRASGLYNVAGGEPVSMRDLAQQALAAVPGSTSRVLASGRPDPQESYRAAFSSEKARRDLGWVPRVSLADGLARVAVALREEGAGRGQG